MNATLKARLEKLERDRESNRQRELDAALVAELGRLFGTGDLADEDALALLNAESDDAFRARAEAIQRRLGLVPAPPNYIPDGAGGCSK